MKKKYFLIVAVHSKGMITTVTTGENKWEAMRKIKVDNNLDNFIPVRIKRISVKLYAFVFAINKGFKNKELQNG